MMRGMNGAAWALVVVALMATASPGQGRRLAKGNLSADIALLNRWGKQPKAVQQLYESAYRILEARPDATFADVSRDAEFQRLCEESGVMHLGGPMLGNITPHGVRVWLRTVRPAKVEVRLTVHGREMTYGPVESTPETDLTAIVPVVGLEPASRYPYQVLVDGRPIPIPGDAAITTVPDDRKPGKVRIAFGTCAHRKGLGNTKQAELIRSRNPAVLLLYGDIAVQDRMNHAGLCRADYLLRDFFGAWRGLAASVPVCATWDDHDYWANDASGIPKGYTKEDQATVWEVFRHSWNNPSYGFGDERRGVFLRTRVGSCDIVMTDGRFFRTGRKRPLLGEEQMKWLEAQLLECKGPFIILSSGTMWSDYVSNGKDSWGVYDPEGRERIFQLIEKNRIGGVLLISGDRHGARGFRIPRPSGYTFYEFEPASLGSMSGPPAIDPAWHDVQLFGISGQYAFGEFTIDATLPDPEVTFRLIREEGTVVYEITLTRSQLTPPGK